mmetsp:Transcript_26479/g.86987  ORF Transcript_26479/g.86987 Transcript_26479/m.86987 type:complete len:85 (-) Transcript_26479:546-800(-)
MVSWDATVKREKELQNCFTIVIVRSHGIPYHHPTEHSCRERRYYIAIKMSLSFYFQPAPTPNIPAVPADIPEFCTQSHQHVADD